MNKRALSLTLSILLGLSAAGSAAGPMSEAPASVETGGISAPAAAAIGSLETGNAVALSALTSNADSTVAFIRAAAANPDLLADAGVRAEADKALGAAKVARLQAAAAALRARGRNDAAIRGIMEYWRRQSAGLTPAKAQHALANALRDTASWSKDAAAVAVAQQGARRATLSLAKPGAFRGWRSAAAGAMLAAGVLGVPAAGHAALLQPAQLTQANHGSLLRIAAQDQPSKVAAKTIQDALDAYQPSAQVYVLGHPSNSDARLADRVLAEIKGKPEVVVLVFNYDDNESNPDYANSFDGHEGLSAIEYGVNEGLYNKGGILDQKDPVSGERQGSILTIVFYKHKINGSSGKMYFHGSDQMVAHGIAVLPPSMTHKSLQPGDRVWPGDLDQWASAKLRNGHDIVGAVRDTFSNIQGLVDQRIAAEVSGAQSAVSAAQAAVDSLSAAQADFARRHAAAAETGIGSADVAAMKRSIAEAQTLLSSRKTKEATQAVAGIAGRAQQAQSALSSFDDAFNSAQSELAESRAAVDSLDKAAAAFRSAHRDAAGDLARPKTNEMRDALKSAEAQIGLHPQDAKAQILRVLSQARDGVDALAQFPNGEKRFQDAQKLLKQLRGNQYASSARTDLDNAEAMLTAAGRELHEGSSGWNLKMQAAEGKLQQAKADEGSAADAAVAKRDGLLGLGFLLLFGFGGLPLFRRRKIAPARAEVEEAIKPWDAKFTAMDDSAIDHLNKWLLDNSAVGWQGKTATLVGEVREEAGTARLYREAMRGIYGRMTSLARPSPLRNPLRFYYNLVSTKNFDEVKNLLGSEEVPVTLEERRQGWEEKLYGPIDNFKPVKMTFSALVDSHNGHAKKAVEAQDRVEQALKDAASLVTDVQGAVAAVTAEQAAIKNADQLFQVPALFGQAMPKAKASLDAAVKLKDNDPVGALEAGGAQAKRIAAEAQALAAAIIAARAGSIVRANEAAAKLREAKLSDDWKVAAEARLSSEADAMAKDVADKSIAARIDALTKGLDAISANAADVLTGAQALAEQSKRVDTLKTSVADARAKIGQLIGLPADQILVEKDAHPDDQIASGVQSAAAVQKALNAGQLDAAKKAFNEMKQSLDNAQSMVAAALKTAEGYQTSFTEHKDKTEALKKLSAERQTVLDSIRKDFDKSVLSLGAGDASHPDANGTIDDNIEEAQAAIDAAEAKTQRSEGSFKAGRVLEAADLLTQAEAHQKIAQDRLDEISEKRARLDAQVVANNDAFTKLKARGTDLEKVFKDDRAMLVDNSGKKEVLRGTMGQMQDAENRFDQVDELVHAKKGDPFKAAQTLAEVNGMLDKVELSYKNDIDAYNSFRHAADAASNQMAQAEADLQRFRGTPGADHLTGSTDQELQTLKQALQKVSTAATDRHLDWPFWEREANRIITEAAHKSALLKDELSHANQATEQINEAASQIANATSWSGGFGVPGLGSPGQGDLNAARSALSEGDYDSAMRYAAAASQAASQAIANAEAQVAAAQAAAAAAEAERQRQIEAERQARQEAEDQARRQSSDNNGSWNNGSGNGSTWGNDDNSGAASSDVSSGSDNSGAASSDF